MSDLTEQLAAAFDDRTVAGVAREVDLAPAAGPGAPVASPTYKDGQVPESAGFVPTPGDGDWLTQVATGDNGRPEVAMSVVLDAVASQSGRAEAALWEARSELGGLPGFTVRDEVAMSDGTYPVAVSSWHASHRHVDAWIKYAAVEGGSNPLWADGGDVRDLLANMNTTDDATTAFQYAPNSLLYGFWLSSGSVRRHRQARVYTSEIVGWGAHRHYGGAAKVDPLPASQHTSIVHSEFGSRKKKGAAGKPSELGFGPVPDNVRILGYTCERIAARASLSLSLLRGMRYGDDPQGRKQRAASVALLVLGMAGDALARHDTHLRSGCDLVPTEARWGLRVSGQSAPEPLTVQQPDNLDWWAGQLAEAMTSCREVGLEFAKPIELVLSKPQRAVLVDGIAKQSEDE